MKNKFNEYDINPYKLSKDEDPEEDYDEDDDDDEDEGISFEKFAELSAKLDPFENDVQRQKEIITSEGKSWEDWEFYKNVWNVEIHSDPQKTRTFAEIYSKFSIIIK